MESYCVVFADVLDIPLLAKIKKNNTKTQGVRLGIKNCTRKIGANLSIISRPLLKVVRSALRHRQKTTSNY